MTTKIGDRAAVLGASMAGLLAARVLADRYDKRRILLVTQASMIVLEDGYDTSEPAIDEHVVKLKASGADIFVSITTPKFAAQAIKKAAEDAGRLFGRLDGWLEGRKYVGGQHFTMGDIPVGIAAYRWFQLPIEREDYPNLARWYEALTRRSGFAEHIMNPLE